MEQHTTRCTSGQYNRPVTDRARVYYPFRAVPGVNSAHPIITVNTISILTVQYGHARSNYTQLCIHSLGEEEEEMSW